MSGSPESLLLTYYGDDFTGSTDVLEALSLVGVPTTLFLEPPAPQDLERFPGTRAVGVAGTGRSLQPAEMEERLPEIFARLRDLGAPITHYKVCSTFDSSPEVGSIGRALEIGRRVFETASVPLLVAVPRLGRYCVFGNLFARSGQESSAYRLDRHPTMSRHPVTPMGESDLLRHLALQTDLASAGLDVVELRAGEGRARERYRELAENAAIVLLDAVDDRDMASVGELIWSERPPFAVASSGLAYALGAAWSTRATIKAAPMPGRDPCDQLLVLSGSCSPVSADQIRHAKEHGFAVVAIDTAALVGADGQDEAERVLEKALARLASGQSTLLHTCLGPDDPRIDAVRGSARGRDPRHASGRAIGTRLGSLLRTLLEEHPVARVIVAGGDTSGDVAGALEIGALTFAAPLVPGGPLCRIHAPGALDGVEIAFKGGQAGGKDIYVRAREGRKKGTEPWKPLRS